MRRYLVNYNKNFEIEKGYDIVIIGAGIAGLYMSLMLPKNLKIAVFSKKDIYDSDSCLAQGGIAASIEDDDRSLHIKDTINAGCYVNNLDAVKILVDESQIAIDKLIGLGVDFDRNSKGDFYRSLEANHSFPRILHVNGDATGKGIMDVLINQVKSAENIDVISDIFAIDIVDNNKKCTGVTAYHNKKFLYFKTKFCIIASGGIGQIFSKTTNVDVLTGDGIAMASRAGAVLENMEYVQFHPTAFFCNNVKKRMFLISEAVRGEGAVLRNIYKDTFMKDYDARKDMAPRDIVARAIKDQMDKFKSKYVYLDATMYNKNFLQHRFKTIYSKCKDFGVEMDEEYIPVTPAQHYFMGGIKVDMHSRTNIEDLYAVGECACTGVHGANRLASNSLMEAVVFGRRAALDISERIKNYEYEEKNDFCRSAIEDKYSCIDNNRKIEFQIIKDHLKELMEQNVGIIRNVDKLNYSLKYVDNKIDELENLEFDSMDYMEIYNMYQVAHSIISAALQSKISIGSNYVEEYCKSLVK
ncbi:L-aspartate oxidase [Clostridium tyrobutyricum]|uniref:L-aspartate oxidase n=1 Tax=Clostridium tyrobutyricum TaxID=1519 RepID=UPI00057E9EB5|nr:L-aspartate oxidase [Clostridium tyrobutyricum]MBV4448846.1 L-aspartate oxidase [Clostridium tyrobutyricum]MCH4198895.1 L-aspartate oxidase [Clostridium tyrobutyricum]MCH4236836.1 L-aspartate oxidase [Clostridium tyrobutyricum]MCH4258707.1 L-aspartate oxidase [Clostridium tyrobutyricum]MCI1239574.1 L-aspartate oxidase [Clostridium tyrobutyricum]